MFVVVLFLLVVLTIACFAWDLILRQLVFKRHAHERTIDFVTISEAAQVDLKEVREAGREEHYCRKGGLR